MKETKEEYSVAIRYNSRFAGEGVFHNFDYFGNVELGIVVLRCSCKRFLAVCVCIRGTGRDGAVVTNSIVPAFLQCTIICLFNYFKIGGMDLGGVLLVYII